MTLGVQTVDHWNKICSLLMSSALWAFAELACEIFVARRALCMSATSVLRDMIALSALVMSVGKSVCVA